MWVVKARGESYYVEHVTCSLSWTTKETPDNSHTKGSIKIKNCLLTIDSENSAEIKELTEIDRVRLWNQERGIRRVVVKEGPDLWKFQNAVKQLKTKHSPIKSIGGACSSRFYITDILDPKHFSLLSLALAEVASFRELKPNEGYYRWYSDPKNADKTDVWEEDEFVDKDDD